MEDFLFETFNPQLKEAMEVLLIEDDPNLGQILKEYLEVKGYTATLCNHGGHAMEAFRKRNYSIIILDVMLPGKDGFTLAKEIRENNKKVPIIFLTAKSMKEDTLEGLRIGGDDYLTKPFSMEELLLRMKAILRRTSTDTSSTDSAQIYKIGKLTFDYHHQTLRCEANTQKLTSKESELLKLLVLNINQTVDRTTALKLIWHDDSYFNARSMDVYITRLRKYLKSDLDVEILTIHREGFKLVNLRKSENTPA